MSTSIRPATQADHKDILAIAKLSPYTRDFGSIMFSSPEAYLKGWIRVLVEEGRVIGFTCVRHKTRSPETVLYFIGIHPAHRSLGYGAWLMTDLIIQTPHKRVALNVMKENERALKFYLGLGFVITGEAIEGKAHHLERHL